MALLVIRTIARGTLVPGERRDSLIMAKHVSGDAMPPGWSGSVFGLVLAGG